MKLAVPPVIVFVDIVPLEPSNLMDWTGVELLSYNVIEFLLLLSMLITLFLLVSVIWILFFVYVEYTLLFV